MPTTNLSDWLTLWHVPGLGPRIFLKLLHLFNNDPANILRASVTALEATGLCRSLAHAIHNHSRSATQADLAWLDSNQRHHIVTFDQSQYPDLLKKIHDPPPILYISGNLDALNEQPCVAMVGSRKATSLGLQNAFQLAKNLAQTGITIVSGLAYGIDAQAHKGALQVDHGRTLAVLGNGLDHIYPSRHRHLSGQCSELGALISEFPPGTRPLPQHFPRRNRIISGLCLGTVIVEAAKKSGSLITARYALEQNREVFALPGPVNSLLSEGCHALIQDGAKLVTNINDILVEFPSIQVRGTITKNRPGSGFSRPSDSNSLLKIIEYIPLPMDTLIEKSGLTPDQVSSMLIELEISGHVICDANGYYSRSVLE